MAKGGVSTAPAQVYTPFYSKLKDWIQAQQDFEATSSQPAPLTKVQRKLLSELEQTLVYEPVPDAEPDIGGNNWVGLLLEYRAANQKCYGSDVEFALETVPGPLSTLRWRYQVRLEEAATSFPDGVQPSFARKIDAKQYAAKCAIEWLRANEFMPANGVKFPKKPMHMPSRQVSSSSSPATAAAKRQKLSSSVPAAQSPRSPPTTAAAALNGSTAQNGARASSPASSISSIPRLPASTVPPSPVLPARNGTSPYDADERSAPKEVVEMCLKLGFQPPKYKLTQDPQDETFWGGYPEFEVWSLGSAATYLPPAGAIHVEGALGKKLARQQIAELLLPYLRRAWDARQARNREFMQERPVATSAGAPNSGA